MMKWRWLASFTLAVLISLAEVHAATPPVLIKEVKKTLFWNSRQIRSINWMTEASVILVSENSVHSISCCKINPKGRVETSKRYVEFPRINSIAVDRRAEEFWGASFEYVYRANMANGNIIKKERAFDRDIDGACIADRPRLLAVWAGNLLKFLDPDTLNTRCEMSMDYKIVALRHAPNDDYFVCVLSNGDLYKISPSENHRSKLPMRISDPADISFSEDGEKLMIVSRLGEIFVYKKNKWNLEKRINLQLPISACEFSGDGQIAVLGTRSKSPSNLYILNIEDETSTAIPCRSVEVISRDPSNNLRFAIGGDSLGILDVNLNKASLYTDVNDDNTTYLDFVEDKDFVSFRNNGESFATTEGLKEKISVKVEASAEFCRVLNKKIVIVKGAD